MKIQIIGDSLTGSYGVVAGKAWTDFINNKYGEKVQINTYNGYSTTDLLSVFSDDVTNFNPDVLFLLGGTNDALSLRSASQALNNIMLMYEECERRGIKTTVILPPLLAPTMASASFGDPIPYYEKSNEMLKRLRRLLMDQSQESSLVVYDLEPLINSLSGSVKPIFTDGIHFSEFFHEELYLKFTEKFSIYFNN